MQIAFLGGGNMATAMISGLVKKGFMPQQIAVVEVLQANRTHLETEFNVRTTDSPTAMVESADIVVLAVKPQQMQAALAPLAGKLHGGVVLSIAAGMRITRIMEYLGGYAKIIRAMPNTPALISAGMTGMYASDAVSDTQRQIAEQVLAAIGKTCWVDTEDDIDAVTALSGSGPAYVFYFLEALIAGGERLGLSADQAALLAKQTLLGAAQLAYASEESPTVLRERVTSKGGTTAAALDVFKQQNMDLTIAHAMLAAQQRAHELGKML